MKIRMKFLFGAIAVLMCFGNANAFKKQCYQGCFCPDDGKFENSIHYFQAACSGKAQSMLGPHLSSEIVFGDVGIKYDCAKRGAIQDGGYASYCVEEFSALYADGYSVYGIKDNKVVYLQASYLRPQMYPCPFDFPNSDDGANSLLQCYTYDLDGNKVYFNVESANKYYEDVNMRTVSVAVKNLQSALDKANQAAQDLQNALDQTDQKIRKTAAISSEKLLNYNNSVVSNKATNLIKQKNESVKLEAIKQIETPKRAAAGPFKSSILNSYAGGQ